MEETNDEQYAEALRHVLMNVSYICDSFTNKHSYHFLRHHTYPHTKNYIRHMNYANPYGFLHVTPRRSMIKPRKWPVFANVSYTMLGKTCIWLTNAQIYCYELLDVEF
jgi:hypothetical protein